MSSLRISGWTDNDIRMELKEIINSFGSMSFESMIKINSKDLQQALSTVSLMYVTPYGKDTDLKLKKEAFQVAEILEYVNQKCFSYAIGKIKTALDSEIDENPEFAFASEHILDFYIRLFEKDGFKHCRFFNTTFNSKYGNVTLFPQLKIECYDGREMLEALVLANEIIRSPYDFLDCANSCLNYHFDSIESYLKFLAKENFNEYINQQMNKDIFVDYYEPNTQITELLK